MKIAVKFGLSGGFAVRSEVLQASKRRVVQCERRRSDSVCQRRPRIRPGNDFGEQSSNPSTAGPLSRSSSSAPLRTIKIDTYRRRFAPSALKCSNDSLRPELVDWLADQAGRGRP
ncbi:hypothetical protein HPB50_010715 [Hyalomma asiaticum]|uniref:Uncharacterized protein n=1 Tax=Hyalomma asiaticum TaxID=266040 RepID=A0ACB7SJW1_HYAAI|nr:hypothetical protein HPB50_010715 [Hyalomma asiaticum]